MKPVQVAEVLANLNLLEGFTLETEK